MHGQMLQRNGHKFSLHLEGNNNRAVAVFLDDTEGIHNIPHALNNPGNCMNKKIDYAPDFYIPVP